MTRSSHSRRRAARSPVGRIVGIYLVFGLLWILTSDLIIAVIASNEAALVRMQTYKGSAFVLVTSLLLFLLLAREWTNRSRKEEQLRQNSALLQSRTDELLQSEMKYGAILENSPDLVWAVDSHLRLIVASSAYREAMISLFGRSYQIGDSVLDDGPSGSAHQWESLYSRALRGESFLHEIVRTSREEGQHCYLECSFSPIKSAAGAVVGVACFGRDVSQRRLWADRERRRRLIMESLVSGVPLETIFGRIVEAVEAEDTSRLCSILLLDEAGERLLNGAAPNLPEFYNHALHGVAIGPDVGSCGAAAFRRQRVIAEDIATDPSWQNFRELAETAQLRSCWSEPILAGDGSVLGTFAVYRRAPHKPDDDEISQLAWVVQAASIAIQHRRSENALRESDQRFRLIWTQSTDGIRLTDAVGKVLMANPSYCEMVGMSREEVEGQPFALIYPEAERDSSIDEYRGRIRSRSFPVHVHTEAKLWNGKHVWFGLSNSYLARDGEIFLLTMFRDITERKIAERLQFRSQRLEALGTLAGGIAHDLNNALAPIMLALGLLRAQFPQHIKLLDTLEGSAIRAAEMVRQLLTFAKGAEGRRVPVKCGPLLEEIKGLIDRTFPKNIKLEVHFDQAVPPVLGDATQLHQVLLNLCVNARDAMPQGGILRIGAHHVEVDQVYPRAIPEGKPGSYVIFEVRDSGEGIPAENIDRIFDPFFTTKTPDKGTGLGLSTVVGILKGHGGFLTVYSQPGQGSTFTAYIPVGSVSGGPIAAIDAKADWIGNGEVVLFVDDEAAVREIAHAVLLRLNFIPVLAGGGADALLRAAEHRKELRAVITDLHMPEMDGLAFLREFRATFPDLPCVISSGRLDNEVAEELRVLGVTARLDKPFTQRQMMEVLKGLILSEAEA